MKLPHLLKNDDTAHTILLLLGTTNLLLIVIIFFLLVPQVRIIHLPKLITLSGRIPLTRLNLISPTYASDLQGIVPLVTTLSNGPKITKADLMVDGQKIQVVTPAKTEKLTLYWDTTKHANGRHELIIHVVDDKDLISTLSTSFVVQNKDQIPKR